MSNFAERFRQEGLEAGLEAGLRQGMQQGVQQGEATALLRLLLKRFGEVPLDARRQIESADAATLLEWLDRVLTAASIDEVLH